ncbi:MAG: hypothetical protein EOM14_13515, partial [Clostridia bacterium]|nr:hypothetical protein [Clostridia bacterium]
MVLFTGFSTTKTTYLIADDDLIYTVNGYSGDISEAFIRAGIVLNDDDTFVVSGDDELMRIDIIRTVVTSQTTYAAIPYNTIRRANPELPAGTEQLVQAGADGAAQTLLQQQCLALGDGLNYRQLEANPVLTQADLPEDLADLLERAKSGCYRPP